uniref:hypothetical protein n=1 Tax=Sulfuriferula sp. GW6 TaxID=3345112 RepID=UPI0039F6A6B6
MNTQKPKTGQLAKTWCNLDLPLQVLQNHKKGRFYIGTFDPGDGPISRESEEYFDTREAAQAALDAGTWTQKTSPL